jgi:DNA primase
MHQQIESVCLCLDNDRAGLQAAKAIRARLPEQYRIKLFPPKEGKDYNEQLMRMKGLQNHVVTRKSKEKEEYTL